MFCPICDSLAFPVGKLVKCDRCGFRGEGLGDILDTETGWIDPYFVVSSKEVSDLSRHEVAYSTDRVVVNGVKGIACLECDSTDTVANSSMRRAASRDHTQHYECKDCGSRWFER